MITFSHQHFLEKQYQEKIEQREKLATLEIQNISKELQVKTEMVNEQVDVIKMKDDKIATQKLELEKAREGILPSPHYIH